MYRTALLLPDTGEDFIRTLKLTSIYAEQTNVLLFTDSRITSKAKQKFLLSGEELATIRTEIVRAAAKRVDAAWEKYKTEKRGKKCRKKNKAKREKLRDKEFQKIERVLQLLPHYNDHAREFLEFPQRYHEDLSLLEQEGILVPICQTSLAKGQMNITKGLVAFKDAMQLAKTTLTETLTDHDQNDLWGIFESCPPSCCDLLYEALATAATTPGAPDRAAEQLIEDMEERGGAAFVMWIIVLLITCHFGVITQWTITTWIPELQEVLDAICYSFARQDKSLSEHILARRSLEHRLGRLVLTEEVPDVTDLPFQEILNIRRRRQAEIEAFRDGLAEIAADVDPALDEREIQLALDTKLRTVVKPRVNDLNRSVGELQKQAMVKLFEPSPGLVSSTVVASIAYLTGPGPASSVAISGAAAVGAGELIKKLYQFLVKRPLDEKELLEANSWTLLYHLKKNCG